MKRVLMTVAIALAVVFAVSLDCPAVSAGYVEDVGSPSHHGVQVPPVEHGVSGVCGGGSSEGDPDDLGGGFRSTNGQTKQTIGEIKPPVTPLVTMMLNAQRIWFLILH